MPDAGNADYVKLFDTPSCRGHASWNSKAQAEYVAENLSSEYGTTWEVVPHGDHFHTLDKGDASR